MSSLASLSSGEVLTRRNSSCDMPQLVFDKTVRKKVFAVLTSDLDSVKDQLKNPQGALSQTMATEINWRVKAALYRVAGVILIIASVAFVAYLQMSTPVSYVWTVEDQLSAAAGVVIPMIGAIFSFIHAHKLSQKPSTLLSQLENALSFLPIRELYYDM